MERTGRRWPAATFAMVSILVGRASANAQDAAATAAAAPAPRLVGRAVDEDGEPLADVAVGAFAAGAFVDTAALLARPPAVTAADGTWSLAADAALRWGVVVLAARDRQSCALRIRDEAVRDGADFGDTLLVPGSKLVGRVRDEAGAPLAGVRLRVESSIANPFVHDIRLLAGAVSDAKGIFVVPCVPRSGLRLTATAPGRRGVSRLVAQSSPCDLTLQRAGIVSGTVVDGEGAPVAGIALNVAMVENDVAADPKVESGADGAFAIDVPLRGTFRIAGSDGAEPYRRFSSTILHGPADDVTVSLSSPERETLEVVAVDAATGAAIPAFEVAPVTTDPANVATVLFHHRQGLRPHEGTARLLVRDEDSLRAVLVQAPGHAFAIAAVGGDLATPLRVELGPEAVLVGRVVDAETGEPMAGAAVRALPKSTITGSGGDLSGVGPRSAADGTYRVGMLGAGEYQVQVHAADRAASAVAYVTLEAGTTTTLDLTVPRRRWLEFELQGTLPPGPAPQLAVAEGMIWSGGMAGFQHQVPNPPAQALRRTGAFRLGPVGAGRRKLQVFVPSRTRVGGGTTIDLGEVDPDAAARAIALPDLTTRIVRGRVVLPSSVASERVAVLVSPATEGQAFLWQQRPNAAGLDAGGNFELDLPPGSYCVQLADLQTGIVFHVEPDDLALPLAEGAVLRIEPAIHWLDVECVPQIEGGEVALHSFRVALPMPRTGALAFYGTYAGGTNRVANGNVPFAPGATTQRWLVPACTVEIEAQQNAGVLRPWANGWTSTTADRATVEVAGPEQRVTLRIPPLPPDAELLRR